MTIRLDEDWHVHSTFSDGADTLDANVERAVWRGLRHLGCVDHVRRDSSYLPFYVEAVKRARMDAPIELSIGIEAKILDREGTLDMPDDIAGVELIYVADHRWPGATGPLDPRIVRDALAAGDLDPVDAVSDLVEATVNAMRRNVNGHRMVLAHLFSVLPKVGVDEESVDDDSLCAIADAALETETMIEASERWHCPSARMIRVCEARGVAVVAGTDAHRARDVGNYHFVHDLAAGMSGT